MLKRPQPALCSMKSSRGPVIHCVPLFRVKKHLVCFGPLAANVVVMVYTERPQGARVISLRKAEKYEARYYRQLAKDNLG